MGAGTDDFKRLTKQHAERGFHPELPTQAMPTPVTRGQRTLSEAREALRQMRRVQEAGTFYAWRLGLLGEHGLYDPTPVPSARRCQEASASGSCDTLPHRPTTEPRMWAWEE
jgi:hypothetical protein